MAIPVVEKLWNYCNVLRDDGMSYGDYPGSSPGQADTEAAPAHPCARGIRTSCSAQLTYLLFLKMADERTKAPYNQKSPVPEKYSWPSLAPSLALPRKRGRGFSCGDELLDQFSGSRYPALARKPNPRLLPRAFGGTDVHWTSVSCRLTHHTLEALGNQKGLLGLI